MKLIKHLEKSKDFWYVLLTILIFFFLRFPSLFEPDWYGDEGIYQTIGLALDRGKMLYSQAWDNKPPLLYVLYALLQADQFIIRLASLLFGLISVIILYFLAKKLFQNRTASLISSILFAILFGTPLIEGNIANAENFFLLFTIGAAYLVYSSTINKKINASSMLFISGIVLGIGFLFKTVVIFDFAAFFLFLSYTLLPDKISRSVTKSTIKIASKTLIPILCGFLLPILIACIYFAATHTFLPFIQSAFLDNVGYVGWKNNFIIPQGFLVLKVLILLSSIVIVFVYRKSFTKPFLFIILWTVFSVFNAFFSQRPYTHYVLVALPSYCLAIGSLITIKNIKQKGALASLLLAILFIMIKSFNYYGNAIFYYSNFFKYLSGKETVTQYQSFFDKNTPRDYAVAQFLKTHTKPYQTVFLWGNSAQIYALSKTLPPGRFTVAYHITENNSTLKETAKDLTRTNPRYVIILSNMSPIPFDLTTYTNSFNLSGASIYERTY